MYIVRVLKKLMEAIRPPTLTRPSTQLKAINRICTPADLEALTLSVWLDSTKPTCLVSLVPCSGEAQGRK